MKTWQEKFAEVPCEQQAETVRLADEFPAELGLSGLREMRAMSQQQIATKLSITQPAVAAIERRGDEIKVATLKRYAQALGGKLSITIELPDGRKTLSL